MFAPTWNAMYGGSCRLVTFTDSRPFSSIMLKSLRPYHSYRCKEYNGQDLYHSMLETFPSARPQLTTPSYIKNNATPSTLMTAPITSRTVTF